jgi:hypothetical protein
MERKTIFQTLEGRPAQILVVAGLALTLLTPLFPRIRHAAVERARSSYSNAEELIELEMEEIKREQEREGKETNVVLAGMTFEQQQASSQQRQQRAAELQRIADEKREELKKRYDRTKLKRQLLTAQTNASGMWWHGIIGWIGSVLLIIGLLTLTATTAGVTQKVFLVVLLLVLFSELSGVRVDFLAAGQMGGEDSRPFVEALRSNR